jgi:hypothetical protein
VSDGDQKIAPAQRYSAAELVAAGYRQTSWKYGLVARLPPGKTGVEALAERSPELVRELQERMEAEAADIYRRIYAQSAGHSLALSRDELEAFRASGGVSSR